MVFLETRAQALQAKQDCHRLAAGGRPQAHLSYWVGLRLLRSFSELRFSLHAEYPSPHFSDLATLLLQVIDPDFVRPNDFKSVTSAALYRAFLVTTSTPPPKMQN